QKNRIQFSDKTDRINEEALILCNKRANLEKGDVLFSGTGTIGEVAIVDETPNNWSIKEGVYSLKPISANINSKFLMYVLQTRNIKEKYSQKVVGGTVKSITMADLKKIDIPVPPLEVQNE
ncbi:restriction endonuclease subunit S, partial [Fusobacterium polymorphum]